MKSTPLLTLLTLLWLTSGSAAEPAGRQDQLLTGPGWSFLGGSATSPLPPIDSDAYRHAAWAPVEVPHDFQTRAAFDTFTKGWYRRQIAVDASAEGRQLYLVFEGAASIADVYLNGQHLGQHRGGYTRFVFDATRALHAGADNELAVLVDDSPEQTRDCLPVVEGGLYKVWGGLYRKVWLLTTDRLHIDPTDDAAPGVYLTPQNVSAASAQLHVRALVRNAAGNARQAEVRVAVLDPDGRKVADARTPLQAAANQRTTAELTVTIARPQLWLPRQGRVYHVQTEVWADGTPVDRVTQPTGFRTVAFDWKEGHVTVNGQRTTLAGADLHQETEEKGSAVNDADLTANLDALLDMGANFVRLAHYPRAAVEYDGCDRLGLMCWAENGNSTGRWDKVKDLATATSAQITTEMVKQNYNHPAIVFWSVGNEAATEPADQCVPIVKALDSSRPVVVANMQSALADHKAENTYPGWYNPNVLGFRAKGFISEIGAGGVVTTHCDYRGCDWKVNTYEPEEYQQIVAEYEFQQAFGSSPDHLGLFCWWNFREFTDNKYKKPIGINSKGLLTYAGDKKDVYYLYRCFLRPDEPTLAIASKRYFLRTGAADNGIKVYSSARRVTLTLNGEKVSTVQAGQYTLPGGPWTLHAKKAPLTTDPAAGSPSPAADTPFPTVKIDHVFYWPVPLHPGKNVVTASDESGHTDAAVVYFYGEHGLPAQAGGSLPITGLASTNPANPAHYLDTPPHAQWPIYADLDGTADNSWNALPRALENATWIALRRVTKPDQQTVLSFATTRPLEVYIVATQVAAPAAFGDGFQAVAGGSILWRDNALQLVPAQLYRHEAATGEQIHLALGDRDAVVLLKEKAR